MSYQSQPLTAIMTMQPLHCPQSRHGGQSLRKSRYVPRSFVQHSYHDRSNELPDCTPTVTRGGISTLFPTKLHAAIDRMAADGLGNVCSWQPHGRSFVVHDAKEFEALMPKYFGKKMKLASFQRQLNLYGFARLTHGPDKGGYYSELFLRHRHYLSRKIHRVKVKGNGARSATNPDAEPNFYAMPPVAPVPQPMTLVPAAPAPNFLRSLAPVRSLGPRQVSLNEHDLLQSLQRPAQRPQAPPVNQDSDELDATFWDSMEMLLDNVGESESDAAFSPEDMAQLDSILDPSPIPTTSTVAPEPTVILPSSEPTVLDDEVTEFLEAMFEKEEPYSAPKAGITIKAPMIKGTIAMSGNANAVAYARRGTFRRRSACNAAA